MVLLTGRFNLSKPWVSLLFHRGKAPGAILCLLVTKNLDTCFKAAKGHSQRRTFPAVGSQRSSPARSRLAVASLRWDGEN